MTYLSECSDSLRNEKIEKWKYELKSNEFTFSKFMESERQILQWITEGLPSDETSHQNAIILKQVNNYFYYLHFAIILLINYIICIQNHVCNRLRPFRFR